MMGSLNRYHKLYAHFKYTAASENSTFMANMAAIETQKHRVVTNGLVRNTATQNQYETFDTRIQ